MTFLLNFTLSFRQLLSFSLVWLHRKHNNNTPSTCCKRLAKLSHNRTSCYPSHFSASSTCPFLPFTPTEWMSGLRTHKTLCQAIMVQNYIPPVARTHRTTIQSVSLQPQQHTPKIIFTTVAFSAKQLS